MRKSTIIAMVSLMICVDFTTQPFGAYGADKIDLIKLCKKRGLSVKTGKGARIGIYHGNWVALGSQMQHTLIIRKINNNKATVLYAWGDWPEYDIRRGCSKHIGAISGKVLKINFGNGNRVSYNFFDDDGFATGSYKSSGGTTRGRIDKAKY